MKKILVTGGSGFVGKALISTLLRVYPDIQITSLSINNDSFYDNPGFDIGKLIIETGDIRDYDIVERISRDKDTVVHLAAMKRADQSEDKCHEAVSTNVTGTMNLLNTFQGDTFIQMSSDKAVEPVNCYGATKMVGEKLALEKARASCNQQRFMVIRSGNIIGSTGSVIEIWKNQIAESNVISVTDLDMVRFYVTVEQVVELIIAVLEYGINGKIYITPDDNPVTLRDLVQKAISMYGNAQTEVRCIGLRPGEKMAEIMCSDNEIGKVIRCEEIITGSCSAIPTKFHFFN